MHPRDRPSVKSIGTESPCPPFLTLFLHPRWAAGAPPHEGGCAATRARTWTGRRMDGVCVRVEPGWSGGGPRERV